MSPRPDDRSKTTSHPARVLDTYPQFLDFWHSARGEQLDDQIERWAAAYMAKWPELLAKQQADYAGQWVDWRQIARDRIFPYLEERLPAMAEAREHLLQIGPELHRRAQHALGFETDITLVIYVGIGCGAGWVTNYETRPAILFGLENIAECGWSDAEAIRGLVAHELGHVAHQTWRREGGLPEESGPWWQLYEEGFAQRCEQLILSQESWHESSQDSDDSWLTWCQEHKAWLAGEFLRAVQSGEAIARFFGSWYEIEGHSQCGYFLGCQVIQELEAYMSLREIALLQDVEQWARGIVERYADIDRQLSQL